MHIHLSPRHLTLTAAIHSFVAEKVSHLEQITDNILAAHIVLLHDETKTRKYIVKAHLAVPGPDLHAEDAEDDLYVAIEKVVDKLSQQLRKRKTRIVDNRKHKTQLASEARKSGLKRR